MMEIPAEKNEVTVEVQGEATSVRGNRNLIDELIYNLCSNAVRYNKKGGKVTIITRTEDGHPTLIVKREKICDLAVKNVIKTYKKIKKT